MFKHCRVFKAESTAQRTEREERGERGEGREGRGLEGERKGEGAILVCRDKSIPPPKTLAALALSFPGCTIHYIPTP